MFVSSLSVSVLNPVVPSVDILPLSNSFFPNVLSTLLLFVDGVTPLIPPYFSGEKYNGDGSRSGDRW